ncbi:MAG: hypothetical protein C4K58_02010 [Flavobacteriaceae bacterium]|nr:MAG: hypothetical protein C4K58_02010 [Flavobacteriaceae bacterium]
MALQERKQTEKIIETLLMFCAGITIFTTIGIIAILTYNSVLFFTNKEINVGITDFLFGTKWAPTISREFGILPLLSGTLLTTAIAMIVALPVGLTIAIYLSQYAKTNTQKIFKPMLEMLAAVPTVVYGFFALTVVTPFIRTSIFAAGIALFVLTFLLNNFSFYIKKKYQEKYD